MASTLNVPLQIHLNVCANLDITEIPTRDVRISTNVPLSPAPTELTASTKRVASNAFVHTDGLAMPTDQDVSHLWTFCTNCDARFVCRF